MNMYRTIVCVIATMLPASTALGDGAAPTTNVTDQAAVLRRGQESQPDAARLAVEEANKQAGGAASAPANPSPPALGNTPGQAQRGQDNQPDAARLAVEEANKQAGRREGTPAANPSPPALGNTPGQPQRGQGDQPDAARLAVEEANKQAGRKEGSPAANPSPPALGNTPGQPQRGEGNQPDAARLAVEEANRQAGRKEGSPAANPSPPALGNTPGQPQRGQGDQPEAAKLAVEEANQQAGRPDGTVPGNPLLSSARSNTPPLADAARLFDVASSVQSRKLVEQRGGLPREKPPQQNSNSGSPMAKLPDSVRYGAARDLNPLRTKMAQDLSQSEQETMPDADRAAIEAYFSAVAKETAGLKPDGDGTQVPGPVGPRPRMAPRSKNP